MTAERPRETSTRYRALPRPGEGRLLLDLPFTEGDLVALRQAVAAHADQTTLSPRRVAHLVLVASELATNAVRHGGGRGRLRLSAREDRLCCEVSDEGPGLVPARALPPTRPGPDAVGGRGLWIAYQLCDELDVRSSGAGLTMIATMALPRR